MKLMYCRQFWGLILMALEVGVKTARTLKAVSTIYPVILPVPPEAQELTPRRRVQFLSRHAREALRISAERMHVELGPLEKDPRGAPLPFDGHFWSLTHKPDYVAGVIAPAVVGIDLEKIRPCSAALFRKTASEDEWALAAGGDRQQTFFRYWTAKEAVLKTGGEGIRDLTRCRVTGIANDSRLYVDYAGRNWPVDQLYFNGHVASVANPGCRVQWLLI
jgi:4'-phosphopantetheinyl transferase